MFLEIGSTDSSANGRLRWSPRRLLWLAALLGGLGLVAVPASAQQSSDGVEAPEMDASKTVKLNEEQKRLNNKAIDALTGDSAKPKAAIRYLKAALMVGPKGNLLYMALGRAHQLDGQCAEATEIFEKAAKAPQVESVARQQVMARIEKYRGDLESTCPGFLVVECSPPSVKLSVDDRSLTCGEKSKLPPGKYTVKATYQNFDPRQQPVEIVSMKSKTIRFEFGIRAAAVEAKGGVQRAISAGQTAQIEAYQKSEGERQRERTRADARALASSIEGRAIGIAAPEQAPSTAGTEAGGGAGEPGSARAEPSERTEAFHAILHLRVPFGGYLVQAEDGAVDGGISYGGSGVASVGYVFSDAWALENRLQFDWIETSSLGVKTKENMGHQKIDLRTWRLQNDVRGWFHFLGLGGFIDYRNQKLVFDEFSDTTGTLTMGPTIALSTRRVFDELGQFRVYARWAPLLDGNVNHFQVGVNLAVKYGSVSVEYEKLAGEHDPSEALRTGELLMLNIGVRLPLTHM